MCRADGRHHRPQRLILTDMKFCLQHRDDKLAGPKVIMDQNDFVEMGAINLYLGSDAGFGD